MNMLVTPPPRPRKVTALEAWTFIRPFLAPYLQKLVLAALQRNGVDTTGWPT